MSLLALALALASAVIHAVWNLMVKRAGVSANTPAFAWLLFVLSAAFFAPITVWHLASGRTVLTLEMLPWIAGSAALHTVAFLMLLRAYRTGDLSVVYPLARGTGPLVVTIVGVAILGERATIPSVAGVLLIALGIFVLRGLPWKAKASRDGAAAVQAAAIRRGAVMQGDAASIHGASSPPLPHAAGQAILLGVLIAAYTLWDKQVVGPLGLSPFVLECLLSAAMAIMATPLIVRQAATIRSTFRHHLALLLAVALLSSLSYVMFLSALAMAPASRVAPARELNILIGALLGAKVLGEAESTRRLPAALMMSAGVVLLALF